MVKYEVLKLEITSHFLLVQLYDFQKHLKRYLLNNEVCALSHAFFSRFLIGARPSRKTEHHCIAIHGFVLKRHLKPILRRRP